MATTTYSVYRITTPQSATLTFVKNVEARSPKAAVEACAEVSGAHFAIPSRFLKSIPAQVSSETVRRVRIVS